jgi:hypothetical protein
MTRAEIRENEYQQMFKIMLDRSGKDINSMSDEEKKKFFTAVDKAYKAKSEGRLVDSKKKSLNEDLFTGVLTTVGMILLGKLIFYWIVSIIEGGAKFFTNKVEKETLVKILDKISKNKSFIDDVSKSINVKNGIDKGMADEIVNMATVQSAINSTITKNENKKDIETELKSIFLKAWNDTSIMNPIVSKVKNDIKK